MRVGIWAGRNARTEPERSGRCGPAGRVQFRQGRTGGGTSATAAAYAQPSKGGTRKMKPAKKIGVCDMVVALDRRPLHCLSVVERIVAVVLPVRKLRQSAVTIVSVRTYDMTR